MTNLDVFVYFSFYVRKFNEDMTREIRRHQASTQSYAEQEIL